MTFFVIPVGLKFKLRSLLVFTYLLYWNEHEVSNEIVIMWLDIKVLRAQDYFYWYNSTNNFPWLTHWCSKHFHPKLLIAPHSIIART